MLKSLIALQKSQANESPAKLYCAVNSLAPVGPSKIAHVRKMDPDHSEEGILGKDTSKSQKSPREPLHKSCFERARIYPRRKSPIKSRALAPEGRFAP